MRLSRKLCTKTCKFNNLTLPVDKTWSKRTTVIFLFVHGVTGHYIWVRNKVSNTSWAWFIGFFLKKKPSWWKMFKNLDTVSNWHYAFVKFHDLLPLKRSTVISILFPAEVFSSFSWSTFVLIRLFFQFWKRAEQFFSNL